MAEPLRRQIPRAMAWAFDYLVSGAIFRVLRASGYFGLVLLYFQIMLIWWLVLAAGGGWLIALAAMHGLGLPRRGERSDRRHRRHRDLPCAAAARRPLVRDPDQQPLALSLRVRARRADLLRRPDRGLRAAPHRRGARQRSRRDRRRRPQRRRRAGAGGDRARARARSRRRPPGAAAGAADARLDRAGRGAASQGGEDARGVRAARGRAVGALDRLASPAPT